MSFKLRAPISLNLMLWFDQMDGTKKVTNFSEHLDPFVKKIWLNPSSNWSNYTSLKLTYNHLKIEDWKTIHPSRWKEGPRIFFSLEKSGFFREGFGPMDGPPGCSWKRCCPKFTERFYVPKIEESSAKKKLCVDTGYVREVSPPPKMAHQLHWMLPETFGESLRFQFFNINGGLSSSGFGPTTFQVDKIFPTTPT